MTRDRVKELTLDAISEARQAYEFAPGSYTASAYNAALAAHYAVDSLLWPAPDWAAEFLEWSEER